MRRVTVVVVFVLVAAACGEQGAGVPPVGPGPTSSLPPVSVAVTQPSAPLSGLSATLIADGFGAVTDVAAARGDDRLFVVEKPGQISVVRDGNVLPEPFLDISEVVLSEGNEQGLVTLELHPRFMDNGRAFVFYTDLEGDGQVYEYTVAEDDPDRLDPSSARLVIEAPQPHQYHQSGSISFGPDGYLWLSLGDGGGREDTYENGQDPTTLLATILRLDIDAAEPYAVPPDNPFVEGAGDDGLREVWSIGVRNPWRVTIDHETELLYVPDVGQEGNEEINVVPITASQLNYGWPLMEGSACLTDPNCTGSGMVLPVYEYPHTEGCAIVGGDVYRGLAMPELHGHYVFADYCRGWLRTLVATEDGVSDMRDWSPDLGRLGSVTSLGTDGRGEILVTNLEGEVWRIDPVR